MSDRNAFHPVLILTNFQVFTFTVLQRDNLEYCILHEPIPIPSVNKK